MYELRNVGNRLFASPLLVGILGGAVGMGMDVDHIFGGRVWHQDYLVFAVCIAVAPIGRLLVRLVLSCRLK